MDCEGILNACTINVVPNSARITVTRSDSMYSRTVAGRVASCCAAAASRASTACAVSDVTSFLSSQLYQGRDRSGLLRFFFGSSRSDRGSLPCDADLDAECFLMIRAALRNHMVGARRHSSRLQEFLQRGLMVGVAHAFGLARDRSLHQSAPDESSRRLQPAIQV